MKYIIIREIATSNSYDALVNLIKSSKSLNDCKIVERSNNDNKLRADKEHDC